MGNVTAMEIYAQQAVMVRTKKYEGCYELIGKGKTLAMALVIELKIWVLSSCSMLSTPFGICGFARFQMLPWQHF